MALVLLGTVKESHYLDEKASGLLYTCWDVAADSAAFLLPSQQGISAEEMNEEASPCEKDFPGV